MTYDDGQGALPRGQGQSWDQRGDPADVEVSRHGDVGPRRPAHEPHAPWAGESQHGIGQYGAGPGEPWSQRYAAEPPADFATPGPHTMSRGYAAQRTGPYRDIEYSAPDQGASTPSAGPDGYGRTHGGNTPSRTAATRAGQSGEHAVGPRRTPEQYGAGGYQPRPAFDGTVEGRAEPKAARRSRKPLVFLIIFVLLGIGGSAGWYFLRGSGDQRATEGGRRIADRQVDPVPLTATEVFGSETIPAAEGGGSYEVLKTQASTDCKMAAGGAIAEVLATAGCTQVVRATLTSSDKALVITAGLFNLESHKKAEQAAAAIKTAVDKQSGRFSGLVAGGSSNLINRAAANLAWEVRGHYLAYCLVAHAEGSAIAADDPRTQSVRNDLVGRHLGDVVIHKREAAAGPTTVPSTRPS